MVKESSKASLLQLQTMQMKQRIDAVSYDLKNRIDEYASIEPSILAELLEVPIKGENENNPENWDLWTAYKYVEIKSIENLIKSGYSMEELIDHLEDKVAQDRFDLLLTYMDQGRLTLNDYKKVVSQDEVRLIELTNAEIAFHNEEFPKLLFIYTIFDSDGFGLAFEALLDEYGGAIQCLKTPYELREKDLLDKTTYLTKSIN